MKSYDVAMKVPTQSQYRRLLSSMKLARLCLFTTLLSAFSLCMAEVRFNDKCATKISGEEFSSVSWKFRDNVKALFSAGEPITHKREGSEVVWLVNYITQGTYFIESLNTHAYLYKKLSPTNRIDVEESLSDVFRLAIHFMRHLSKTISSTSVLIENQSFVNELRGVRISLDEIIALIVKNCR